MNETAGARWGAPLAHARRREAASPPALVPRAARGGWRLACRLGTLCAVVALSACAGTAPARKGSGATGPVTGEEIAWGTYRLEGEPTPLRMRDGRWQGPAVAPGSAIVPRAEVQTHLVARGDLDGNGSEEAVVLIEHDPGGSGRFLHLAVVGRRDGRAVMLASRKVGDRVQVRQLQVRGREIVLDVVRAGPQDPMCCPGEVASLAWTLKRRHLVPAPSAAPVARLSPAVLQGTRWALVEWSPGEPARLAQPIEWSLEGDRASGQSGCNRFQATFSADADTAGSLRFAAPAATRMACEPQAMQAEERFLSALRAVRSFGYRNGRLVLQWSEGSAGGALVFDKR